MRRLLKHADILSTVDEKYVYLKDAYLGVADDKIVYIGSEKPSEVYDQEKDMTGKMLIPGLVNTHTHAAMTLLRGIGSDLNLQDWLFNNIFPIEARLTEEDIAAGTKLAHMEMLASGTTSYTDMYIFPSVSAEIAKQTGMKCSLNRYMQCFNPEETYEENRRGPESIELFKKYNGYANGRVKVDFSIHAEYTCNPQMVERYSKDCKELGALMHIHLAETKKENDECIEKYGKTTAEWFYDLGTFENPTIAAHCVWVNDHDLDLLKEKGVTIAHNPTSNMKLGSGFAPIVKAFNQGINISLGTDGAASNNNLNMFEEMHLASVIHDGYKLDPTLMKAEDVFRMATINGARAQGRNDTGSLEVGKKADIVAIDLSKPHLHPNHDPISLLVYASQGSDVCMTMIDGEILYEDGNYFTIDQEETYREVDASVNRLLTQE